MPPATGWMHSPRNVRYLSADQYPTRKQALNGAVREGLVNHPSKVLKVTKTKRGWRVAW